MPPRYAYWTILIDGKATAFRAREREELLPTFNQLARKNADIVMRYFSRGRLWDNPEQAQWANRNPAVTNKEPRDRSWRPGGQHSDPRARFEKKKTPDRKPFRPTHPKPRFEQRPDKPSDRFASQGPREQPKWREKPGEGSFKPKEQRREWNVKPGDRPIPPKERRERPKWSTKPGDRPAQPKERRERPKWQGKPEGKASQQKDHREPRFDADAGKRPGRWSPPPKRKPR